MSSIDSTFDNFSRGEQTCPDETDKVTSFSDFLKKSLFFLLLFSKNTYAIISKDLLQIIDISGGN